MTLYTVIGATGFSGDTTIHLTWLKPANVIKNLTYQYKIGSGSWVTMGDDHALLDIYSGVGAFTIVSLTNDQEYTVNIRATDSPYTATPVSEVLNAAAAVDLGSAKVKIFITSNTFLPNQKVIIAGTTNYDGVYALDSATASDSLVIPHEYVAETFTAIQTATSYDIASVTVTPSAFNINSPSIDRIYRGLDSLFSTDVSTPVYKIMYIFATYLKDFYVEFTAKVLVQMNILTATILDLDFFGKMFGMLRVYTEADTDYRARLIQDVLKEKNTKRSIIDRVQRYSSTPVQIIEDSSNANYAIVNLMYLDKSSNAFTDDTDIFDVYSILDGGVSIAGIPQTITSSNGSTSQEIMVNNALSTPGVDGFLFTLRYQPNPNTALTKQVVSNIIADTKTAGTNCIIIDTSDLFVAPPVFDEYTPVTEKRYQIVTGTKSAGVSVVISSETAKVSEVVYPTALSWRVIITEMYAGDNVIYAYAETAQHVRSTYVSISILSNPGGVPAPTINAVTSPSYHDHAVITGSMHLGLTIVVVCTTATVGTVTYPTTTSWSCPLTAMSFASNSIEVHAESIDSVSSATVDTAILVKAVEEPVIDAPTTPIITDYATLTGSMVAGLTVVITCTTATVGTVTYPTTTSWSVGLTAMTLGDNAIDVHAEIDSISSTTAHTSIHRDSAVDLGMLLLLHFEE